MKRKRFAAGLLLVAALVATLWAARWSPMPGGRDQAGRRMPGDTSLVPLGEVVAPPDNPTTPAKAELGRYLFFDQRLSGDRSTSCAICHMPEVGWGTGTDISPGYPATQHWRNSQTVVNSAYLAKLFWAGEVTSLESQADSAITGNLAGNADPVMIEERLYQVPEYRRRFNEVFGSEIPTYARVLKAIAAFERTVVTHDLPYDRFLRGDSDALSIEARRGLELVRGKARCTTCHNGMLLSDEDFHNLGVPENPKFRTEPLIQVSLRFQHYSRGTTDQDYAGAYRDEGLFYTTLRDEDRGRFRTPPLRYIGHTAPFMHNGVFRTLEEVVAFYNDGGGDDPRKDPLVRPLGLTDTERAALVVFLKDGLTGPPVVVTSPPILKEEPIR